MLLRASRTAAHCRNIGRSHSTRSSNEVRQTFLDHFGDNAICRHKIVPSSKVSATMNDASLTFVNAGMTPFKKVFLGQAKAPECRTVGEACAVANSQRCVRVGGKHNDLEQVGLDGTHHTFFEMLGNWSFNEAYWKKEACELAWQLLTGPLGLPKNRLYVTYFGGGQNVPLDEETRHIWRALGLPEDHILPFGEKDNFWEMGATGPCGPCTEIHFDHDMSGPTCVNSHQGHVVEIWNLVFMQYNRATDGSLLPLPKSHVDTGMGLERLTAVLNGKTSDYDTDLFQPLLQLISRQTKAPPYSGHFGDQDLDSSYRILADHSRMLAVCLADNMLPDFTPKLKQVLRRAVRIAKKAFFSESTGSYDEWSLLSDLCKMSAELLAPGHPEMQHQLQLIDTVLNFERQVSKQAEQINRRVMKSLLAEYPASAYLVDPFYADAFYQGLQYLNNQNLTTNSNMAIPAPVSYTLYDSMGLKEDNIALLAQIKGLSFCRQSFRDYLASMRIQSKWNTALQKESNSFPLQLDHLPETDDSRKYECFRRDGSRCYEFPVRTAQIVGIDATQDNWVQTIGGGSKGTLFLNCTSLYSEAGGQVGDRGKIVTDHGSVFIVEDCFKAGPLGKHVAHVGHVKGGVFRTGDNVKVKLDTDFRLKCMQAHTCLHLLNAQLRSMFKVTMQKSSWVSANKFKLSCAIYQQDFGMEVVHLLEGQVNRLISLNEPVVRHVITADQVAAMEQQSGKMWISIAGESYPDEGLCVIETPESLEPCCGTHVLNTGDIGSFAIVDVKAPSTGVRTFKCVCGPLAENVRKKGLQLIDSVTDFKAKVEAELTASTEEGLSEAFIRTLASLQQGCDASVPYTVRIQLLDVLGDIAKTLKSSSRLSERHRIKLDVLGAIDAQVKDKFVLFDIGRMATKINLSDFTKQSPQKPILLIARRHDSLVARACVPEHMVTESFCAELWLQALAHDVNGKAKAPSKQDPRLVVNMRVTKDWEEDQVAAALSNAYLFAKQHIY